MALQRLLDAFRFQTCTPEQTPPSTPNLNHGCHRVTACQFVLGWSTLPWERGPVSKLVFREAVHGVAACFSFHNCDFRVCIEGWRSEPCHISQHNSCRASASKFERMNRMVWHVVTHIPGLHDAFRSKCQRVALVQSLALGLT